MKKKLAIIVCAVALALALPCIAFAAPSGSVSGDTTTSTGKDAYGNKAELTFTAEGADWVRIRDFTGDSALGATEMKEYIQKGEVVGQATYEITAGDNVDLDNVKVTVVYVTDAEFSGLTCYVFIMHHDGTMEALPPMPVKSDGSVTVNMDKLSEVAFYITKEVYQSNTTPTAAVTDTASQSPKTGIAG